MLVCSGLIAFAAKCLMNVAISWGFMMRRGQHIQEMKLGLVALILTVALPGCGGGLKAGRPEKAATVPKGEIQCVRPGPGGQNIINPECIRRDVAVPIGMKVADLGTVAVATFEIVGNATLEGTGQTVRRAHPDSMEVTDAVMRRLLANGVPLVERDRSATDKLLDELKVSASGLVDETSAPSIGKQLGVKTLIVGRYEFTGEFEYSRNEAGDIILKNPRSISHQTVRIKALDVEKGQIIIDAKFSMTGKVVNVLMPQALVKYGIQQILEQMGSGVAEY